MIAQIDFLDTFWRSRSTKARKLPLEAEMFGDTPVLLSKWVQMTELGFNKAENKEHKPAAAASFVSKYGNTAPRQNTEIQKRTSKYGIISRNIPRL